jgi:DNA (cytosine-5)-methyltransferase 1
VAKGIMKYVVNNQNPYLVRVEKDITPFISEHANASSQRNMPIDEPLRTQCAQVKGGHFSIVAPLITTYYGEKSKDEVRGIALDQPLHTQTTENRHALVSAFLAKNYTGAIGSELNHPIGTVTSIDHHSLVTSNIVKMRGDNTGQATDEPLHTVSAGGTHHAEVRAFLVKYYGTDQDPQLEEPLHTITTKDRFALVTVKGQIYRIEDIGLRMLWPVELFKAQGFPENYIFEKGLLIDHETGKQNWIHLTKTEQVRMVGNSVCPPVAAALVRANLTEMIAIRNEVRK